MQPGARLRASQRFLALLAHWAIMSSALSNYGFLNHGIATVATFAFPSVDVQLFLESSHLAIAIDEIVNRCTPGNNSLSEYIWNSFENAYLLILSEVANSATRIDTSLKKSFVRVNVSNSGNESLIEQQALDAKLPGSHPLEKTFQSVILGKWFRSQPGEKNSCAPVQNVKQVDLAELPDIAKKHRRAVCKVNLEVGMAIRRMLAGALKTGNRVAEETVGVTLSRIAQGELPCHSQVDDYSMALQVKDEVFRSSPQIADHLAKEVETQQLGIHLKDL